MNKYTETVKHEALTRYASGKSVSEIAESLGISRNTAYRWIKTSNYPSSNPTKSNVMQLENKIKRLEDIIEILQCVDCTVNSPLDEKLYALEQLYGKYSVHMLYLSPFHGLIFPTITQLWSRSFLL